MDRGALLTRLVPARTLGRDLGLALAGAAFTALCAQGEIPLRPVPITLQTFGVTLAGLALGARRGAFSQALYVAGGAAGLPVFAGGAGGPAHLFGPTGGYLFAFVLAAALLGHFADRGWADRLLGLALALLGANLLILALGTAWLALFIPAGAALASGFTPFLLGAALKSLALLPFLPAARHLGREG